MTDAERTILRERLSEKPYFSTQGTLKWVTIWMGGLVFAVVGCMEIVPALHQTVGAVRVGLTLGVVLLFFLGAFCPFAMCSVISDHFHWARVERRFKMEIAPLIESALREGLVSSKKVSASSVIVIEEFEDEGSGYLFDVGNTQTLLLKGQTYYPIVDDNPWPNSDFEIVRTTDGKYELGLFCTGHELKPDRTFQTEDCIDNFVWDAKEELFSELPDEVLKRILKPKKVNS